MDKEQHNGWANYATWRINLEVIDGWGTYHTEDKDFETFESVAALADHLKDYAFSVVFDATEDNNDIRLMRGYADAFMGDVNWYEIATHVAEDYPQIINAK